MAFVTEAWEILQKYGNIIRTLQGVYPEHKWEPWKFTRIPEGWWDTMPHQREYFDWLRTPLKLKDMDAWYDVSYKDVRRQPGSSQLIASTLSLPPLTLVRPCEGGYVLFSHYQDNIKKALLTIYPDHAWNEPRFDDSPQAYWDRLAGSSQDTQIRSYMEHIAQQLDVLKAEDWYRVSRTQLRKAGASHVIKKYGGLVALLKRIYPKFRWSEAKFVTAGKKSTQRALKLRLEEIFPGKETIEEYRPSSLSFNPRSRSDVELDIYIPSIRLAFEYQGAQHYGDVFSYGQRQQGKERDPEKTAACLKEGITLISIPYWWDTERDSLANTIRQHRPDLLPEPAGNGEAIPETPAPGSTPRDF
jgi:hypothetical protein